MPTTVKTEVATRLDFPKLIDELGLKVGVELGVDAGFFSDYLLSHSKLERLYSIDAWSVGTEETMAAPRKSWTIKHGEVEEAERKARERLARHGDRSVVIKGNSFDIPRWFPESFPDESVDFVFFDAGHRFSGFALDLINWWPKIKMGGVIAGHDYWRRYRYEVMDVTNAFCVEHKLLMHLTWADKSHDGRAFGSPSFWAVKEELTKKEFFSALPKTLAEMQEAKRKLAENGVRVVLPYQYRDAEEVDGE
jgi:hypothetical protein